MVCQYDLAVLGGGSAGLAAAREAVHCGKSVVLIEPDRLGGTCVNWGCIPKKLFWYRSGKWSEQSRREEREGTVDTKAQFPWEEFKRVRDGYISELNSRYGQRLSAEKVDWVKGEAKFIGDNIIEVKECVEDCLDNSIDGLKSSKVSSGQTTSQIHFKHAIVATGSHSFIPAQIPGALQHGKTSNDFFNLQHQPKRAVVIGFGYIGIELTHMLASLGTETWIVGRNATPLSGRFDSQLCEISLEYLKALPNCHVMCNCTVKQVHERSVTVETPELVTLDEIDFILFATGRVPSTASLACENAHIELERGAVKVNAFHQSSNASVFAVGDAVGRIMLTPVAIAAARSVIGQLYQKENAALFSYSNIPTVVFSHPPIAAVGLTEEEARTKHAKILIYTSNYTPMQNVLAPNKPHSFVKIITTAPPEEQIIGIHIAGEGSDEALQGFAVALAMGARKADFLRTVAIHPTAAEEILFTLNSQPAN